MAAQLATPEAKANAQKLRREFTFARDSISAEARTVDLCFATEAPVERIFGTEVLNCEARSVRMDRINTRAPLLLNHDPEKQIGVVEKAWVDADKKARATVRFSKSALGEEIFQDVKDGIRSLVSVGYQLHKLETEKQPGGPEVQRATDWEPLEISIVSIPADTSAGVGRSLPEIQTKAEKNVTENSVPMSATVEIKPEDVRAQERKRITEIRSIASRHNLNDIADAAINDGVSAEEFGSRALAEIAKRDSSKVKAVKDSDGDLGLSDKEIREFSIHRAIRDIAAGRGLQGLEKEASIAAAKRYGRDLVQHQFLIPSEVARRDMTAGTSADGGYTVQTTVGPLIPLLRNKMVTAQAGVVPMNGLVGNVSLPKHSAAGTAYWTAETGAPTESQQTLGQVSLTPRRCAAFTDVSKQLLAQSSIDAEAFVRNDISSILAVALDKAVIEGSGSSNQPTGVLNTSGIGSVTFGAAPTWAKVVSFETALKTANADIGATKWITTPGVLGKWKTTVKVSGYPVFLCEENMSNGYEMLITNQVSSNKVLFGVWNQAVLGTWAGISVLVDPYSLATSGLVRLVADVYADVGVLQAGAFVASTDSGAQ